MPSTPTFQFWERYRRTCPLLTSQERQDSKIAYKNNILKHKNNSVSLSKQQKFSYLANRYKRSCLPSYYNDSSNYPHIKRTMHITSTNGSNGTRLAQLISACALSS